MVLKEIFENIFRLKFREIYHKKPAFFWTEQLKEYILDLRRNLKKNFKCNRLLLNMRKNKF